MASFRGARKCDSNIASKLIFDGIVDRFPSLDVGDDVYTINSRKSFKNSFCF